MQRFLARRDEDSFLALYRRHADALYRVLARVLGGADVDDAFQETWRRSVDRLASFGGGSRLRTWLCGVALNCAREALRARGAGPGWEVVELDELGAPDAVVPLSEEREALEGALARLAPGYRAVLVLHDVEELTHAEIARVLGIRSGTSKSQLARARAAVRRALADAREEPVRRAGGTA